MAAAAKRIVGLLDVGTSKIACVVCETGLRGVRVLGLGHQRSRGIIAGVLTEPAAAEAAIRQTVAQAERAAGVTLSDLYVAVTCGRVGSATFAATADIGPGGVSPADIKRLFGGAQAYAERDGRVLLHMDRLAYRLDGAPAGENPVGLAAARLAADFTAVTADEPPLRNLIHVVERCHLAVAGLVAAPYASALGVTTADERRLGVTVVDLGEGTTSWAIFGPTGLVACAALATGGHHLTFDIAQLLLTSLAEAERIKTLYATLVNAASDVSDRFTYSVVDGASGDEHLVQTSKARLNAVVRPRIEGVLRAVAAAREAAGAYGPVVVTGGAAQLLGLTGFAAEVLEAEVRMGYPIAACGLTANGPAAGCDSPAFAAAGGLALVVAGGLMWQPGAELASTGYFGRLGRWIGSGL